MEVDRDAAKGLERIATGNGQGDYSARLLPPGTYSVTIDAPGFSGILSTGVGITVGGLVELPVTLSVATGKEVVEVSSQAELVETSRTSTTDTIGQRRIDNLPINGRNYINFTLTDSQVVRDNAPNTGAAPTSGLNMSGQRARSNLVNVDGADATDNSVNGVRSTVSQEAVQELAQFRIPALHELDTEEFPDPPDPENERFQVACLGKDCLLLARRFEQLLGLASEPGEMSAQS